MSEKDDAPSRSSRTFSRVHRSPTTSRARATAQNCPYPPIAAWYAERDSCGGSKVELSWPVAWIDDRDRSENEERKDIMDASRNVLETIGNTPLVRLRRVVPPGCAEVFVKVEGQNPTGSMKDRMA